MIEPQPSHVRDDINHPMTWEPSRTFLLYSISALFWGATIFISYILVYLPEQQIRTLGPFLTVLIAVVSGVLVLRNSVASAMATLAIGSLVIVTGISIFNGGVRTPIVIAYPAIIIMIGWLVSTRAAMAAAGFTIVVITAFVVAETTGFLPVPPPTPAILHGIVQLIVIVASTILIVFLVRSYRHRLAELDQIRNELTRAQAVGKVGSWVFDVAPNTLRFSDETCRILSINEGTLWTKENYLEHTHPQDRDAVRQAWKAAVQCGIYSLEHRVRDGGLFRWVRQQGELEYADNGKVRRAVGAIQDITELKKTESALRSQEEFFRLISENIGDFIAVHDLDGKRIYSSPSYQRFFGEAADLRGTDSFLDLHPDDRERVKSVFRETVKTGRGQTLEYRLVKRDGSVCQMESNGTVIRDSDQNIVSLIVVSRDVSRRKVAEAEVFQLAFYDPLTGLPNRRLLIDRLEKALAVSIRSGHEGAVMFIDLDNFKMLNDTRGHDVGDLLLQQVGERLTHCVREGDTVARLGGDEFVIMLEGLDKRQTEAAAKARSIATKTLLALNQPYRLGTQDYSSTPSIGVTLFGEHREDLDELLKQADMAMYQAKAAGRNNVRFFDPDMQIMVSARARMEDELRDGLWKHQFILHFQAQVGDAGEISGAEVLVRWQHPLRGQVSPAEFVPLAEETGLILPLGHLIMETACYQLAAWADHPEMSSLVLSVNVSARQFMHQNFVDLVIAVLEHTGANPRLLKLELTESLLASNLDIIIEKMSLLQARGISFSLDDFGTGFSSLAYLKRLPLDQVKIDQSFVRDLLIDPNDAAIIGAIISLAKNLELSVIAEGVETEGQRDRLAALGCAAYQGYLFSKPLPLDGFTSLIHQQANPN